MRRRNVPAVALVMLVPLAAAGGRPDGGGFAACCFPDGTCTMSSQPTCSSQGGVWFNGFQCFQDPCLIGACCTSSGTCAVVREDECNFKAGTWLGPDTTCDDDDGDGQADSCETCRADIDGNGVVDVDDLVQLILEWGDC